MSGSINDNPCRFKGVCNKCNKVAMDERPDMCLHIACKDYTPCDLCLNNRELFLLEVEVEGKKSNKRVCRNCGKKYAKPSKVSLNNIKRETMKEVQQFAQDQLAEVEQGNISNGNPALAQFDEFEVDHPPVNIAEEATGGGGIQVPGTPPDFYAPDERAYYAQRWQEYKDYYRNPASYQFAHMVILMEVYINKTNHKLMTSTGGEINFKLLQQQSAAAKLLAEYHKMLPDERVEEETDKETELATIYDTYLKEKGPRYKGGVARMLSPEATVLMPAMHFKFPIKDVLRKCGFTIVEIEEAIGMLNLPEMGATMTAVEVCEFFGFPLRSKYAVEEKSEELDELDRDIALNDGNDDDDGEGDLEPGDNPRGGHAGVDDN